MAQQQAPQRPQRPSGLRQTSYLSSNAVAGPSNIDSVLASPELPLSPTPSSRKRPLDDSQEWILFSPETVISSPSFIRTHTGSTGRTLRTVALSRYSDIGSLDTHARSDQFSSDAFGNEPSVADGQGTSRAGADDDETADLDSLDDGLHAFHEVPDWGPTTRPRLDHSGGTVLPTHDGFGSFHTGGPHNTGLIQEQIWQFERHNARRRTGSQARRRTSSVQRRLDALQEVEDLATEQERIQRIETWRLEQSKALLEEIERETRRMRRISRVSARRAASVAGMTPSAVSTVGTESVPSASATDEEPAEQESWWQRFTRKVIRDLMGIDENLLSVIFGEALPIEAMTTEGATESPGTTPTNSTLKGVRATEGPDEMGNSWEHRLLSRIARELGILVHQLSEHPGAFSTYLRTQETPPYVGARSPASLQSATPPASNVDPSPFGPLTPNSHSTGPQFKPTVQAAGHRAQPYSDPSLWGIEEEDEPIPSDPAHLSEEDRVYWERELDVKLVFNFLRHRFSSRPSSPTREFSDRLSRAASNDLGSTPTQGFHPLPSVAAPSLAPPASSSPPPFVLPHLQPLTQPRPTIGTTNATATGSTAALRPFSQQPPARSLNTPAHARRAALIRANHPLAATTARRTDRAHRHHRFSTGAVGLRGPAGIDAAGASGVGLLLRRSGTASSSCASQSTRRSFKSGGSVGKGKGRFWEGSVGSDGGIVV